MKGKEEDDMVKSRDDMWKSSMCHAMSTKFTHHYPHVIPHQSNFHIIIHKSCRVSQLICRSSMKFGELMTQIAFDLVINVRDSYTNLVKYDESMVKITLILKLMAQIHPRFGQNF
jgi:hypothetical protein